MPQWPAAVLFDFDGVLVNSEPLHFQAFREVLAGEQIELSEQEYFGELIGFDDKGAFRRVYESRGLPLPPSRRSHRKPETTGPSNCRFALHFPMTATQSTPSSAPNSNPKASARPRRLTRSPCSAGLIWI